MNYTVAEINNNIAKIAFSDGSWFFVELTSGMTEAELDDEVARNMPPHLKSGEGTPSFLSAGATRTATRAVTPDAQPDNPAWLQARIDAYGSTASQLEYITENGLDAWQAHVAQIKADNPKS